MSGRHGPRLIPRRWLAGLAATAVLALVGAWMLFARGRVPVEEMLSFLQDHPVVAPLAFVGMYALLVVTVLPTLPLNLAAGVLWGAVPGTALTVAGASLGALIAFWLSRRFFHERVREFAAANEWRWMDAAIATSGWRMVVFLRINPVVPFGPANWLLGVTSISLRAYAIATTLAIVPPALLLASLGASMGGIVLDGGGQEVMRNAVWAGVAMLVLGSLRWWVGRRGRTTGR